MDETPKIETTAVTNVIEQGYKPPEDIPKDKLDAVKTAIKKSGKLSIREQNFVINKVIKKQNNTQAYVDAGYTKNKNTAGHQAHGLMKKPRITQAIEIMQNSITGLEINELAKLYPESITAIRELLHSDKDYAKLGAAKEVIGHIVPKVTINKSLKVVVSAREVERRRKLLDSE